MELDPAPVDVAKLDESFKKDSDRWVDSYINNNATSLHQRAVSSLASTNGHSTN